MAEARPLLPARNKDAIEMTNKPTDDGNLTRRAFIVESMLLAVAVKIRVAFAAEVTESDNSPQTPIGC